MNPDWLVQTALGLRSVILALLMVVAALAINNAIFFAKEHRGPADSRQRMLRIIKALAVNLYGSGAFYGTYTRIEKEFTWSLPPMALGLALYAAYLFCEASGDPKAENLVRPQTEEDQRLEKLLKGGGG